MSPLPHPLVDLLASLTARSLALSGVEGGNAPYLRPPGVVLTDGAWGTKDDRKH